MLCEAKLYARAPQQQHDPRARSWGPMKVLRAQALGMCFGVRDALAAMRAVEDPENFSIHGQLVHNASVQRELAERGFAQVSELSRERPHARDKVVVTAHGISEREGERLAAAGYEIFDTTCPLVRRAHTAALDLSRRVEHVVVLGRAGHVEVRGLVGDLSSYSIVASVDDIELWPVETIGVICQTTLPRRSRRP